MHVDNQAYTRSYYGMQFKKKYFVRFTCVNECFSFFNLREKLCIYTNIYVQAYKFSVFGIFACVCVYVCACVQHESLICLCLMCFVIYLFFFVVCYCPPFESVFFYSFLFH